MEDNKSKNKVRKRRAKKDFKRSIIVIFLAGLIVISMLVVYGYNILRGFNKDNIAARKVSVNEPVNILVLGVDAGDYESHSKNTPKRSDTMMLVRYNPENNKLYMLTIPRDTRVSINGHLSKINTAHAIGGPELAIETVEKLLSVNINYYVRLDYEGFRKSIDAIGGIDVIIPRDMDYDAQDIHIHFKKGEKVHLDGEKAEEFVRWRKNNDGGGYAMGDIGRQETQQEFLVKIIEKLKTSSGIIRLPGLMKIVSQYIKTNIAPEDLARYAFKIKGVNTANIEKKNLPGEPKYIEGISYYIWDKNINDEFIKNFRNGKSTSDNKDLDRDKIKITLLNSTGVSGHAAKYNAKLEEMGYKVTETGNYSQKLKTTRIEDYSSDGAGDYIHSDLKLGNLIKEGVGSPEKGVVIILGLDSL